MKKEGKNKMLYLLAQTPQSSVTQLHELGHINWL